MAQARVQRELEASEPWRKAGFKVKPYYGNDQEDAKRFVKEFPTQLDLDLLKDDFTKGDVVRGDHEGGSNNPIPGGLAAATRAAKQRKADARSRQTAAEIVRHILNPTLTDKYAAAPFTGDAEAIWNDMVRAAHRLIRSTQAAAAPTSS